VSSADRILVGKPEGRIHHVVSLNIQVKCRIIYIEEMERQSIEWISLAQGRDQ
jgi:hypothetical protein